MAKLFKITVVHITEDPHQYVAYLDGQPIYHDSVDTYSKAYYQGKLARERAIRRLRLDDPYKAHEFGLL